jgi:predicted small secreted protein
MRTAIMHIKLIRITQILLLVAISMMLVGCNANVGVGVSVGVPIGNHGYMSVGTSRWR